MIIKRFLINFVLNLHQFIKFILVFIISYNLIFIEIPCFKILNSLSKITVNIGDMKNLVFEIKYILK